MRLSDWVCDGLPFALDSALLDGPAVRFCMLWLPFGRDKEVYDLRDGGVGVVGYADVGIVRGVTRGCGCCCCERACLDDLLLSPGFPCEAADFESFL